MELGKYDHENIKTTLVTIASKYDSPPYSIFFFKFVQNIIDQCEATTCEVFIHMWSICTKHHRLMWSNHMYKTS